MKNLLPATLALLIGGTAQAALIDNISSSLDTATGLEWLDVSATAGLTYAQVAIGAGGYTNEGYRIATGSEVRDLFSRYLQTQPEDMTFGLSYLRAEQLINQMGVTASWNNMQGGTHFTDPVVGNQINLVGFFNDRDGDEMVGLGEVSALLSDGQGNIVGGSRWVAYDDWFTAYGNTAGNIGTFLVKVPEPSSLALLAAGLVGVAVRRRKEDKK